MIKARVQFQPVVRLLLLGLLACTAGCSGSDEEKLVEVTGKVTLDGQPLKVGTVTFHPDSAKGNKGTNPAYSSLQPDGTYKLACKGKMGAPLGAYKVTVSTTGMPAQMPDQGQAMPKPVAINPKFQNAEQSGIHLEVVSSPAPGAYDIKVTR